MQKKCQPFIITDEIRAELRGARDEIDPQQIKIMTAMTSAQRAQQGFEMSEEVIQIASYRLQQQHPGMTRVQAKRIVLARHYRNNPTTILPRHQYE